MKPTVLACIGHYSPGYRSGGPVRSLEALVSALGNSFAFRIMTSDRDLGDDSRYPGIDVDSWNQRETGSVFYSSPRSLSFGGVKALIADTPHDLLYLNSFFAPAITLFPLLAATVGRASIAPILIAPRGEFSIGALELKRWKKRAYISAFKASGLSRRIAWQASTTHEAEDIVRALGVSDSAVHVARDLSAAARPGAVDVPQRPAGLPLRILFLSRISTKKNLDYAIDILSRVGQPVCFTIHGTVEDERYWAACQRKIAALPDHIRVLWKGEVNPVDVTGVMAEHDLFFLPTMGENYGHVIAEALAASLPLLIADTTPWRGLAQAGAGHDLPLDDPGAFVAAIEDMASWSAEDYAASRNRARSYAEQALDNSADVEANRRMFMAVLNGGRGS